MTDTERERINAICEVAGVAEIDDLSDGFHTFRQLYHQRMILFAALVKQNKDRAWKSFRHEDRELCFGGGWFIVGIDTPEGSYTYHYKDVYWYYFDCEELERAKHWDGHTEKDVTRLLSLQKAQFSREDATKDTTNSTADTTNSTADTTNSTAYSTIDLISRQAAIDAISCNITVTGRQNAELVAATIGAFADRIKALPSAQPKRKTGRWIEHIGMNHECSACGKYFPLSYFTGRPFEINYCPDCGARMEGEG